MAKSAKMHGPKWCGKYNVWCNDVLFLTDDQASCEYECGECEYMEVVPID